jgi:hypothetical protein
MLKNLQIRGERDHRWGAGIATGYGINGPYIGIGIHYHILSW